MEFYVRIGGRGRKKIFVPLHGSRGVKNSQIHPYVINELPLSGLLKFLFTTYSYTLLSKNHQSVSHSVRRHTLMRISVDIVV